MTDLWRYEKEPIGMGEFTYVIYRADTRMAYAENNMFAIIIVNGLNRDEEAG